LVRRAVRRKRLGEWFLVASLGIVLYFCFRIIQPFLMPIFLALTLSALLAPLYTMLANKLKGRQSLAALLVCICLTAAILVPVVFLSIALANEANDAYRLLKDPDTLPKSQSWLDPRRHPLIHSVA